MVVFDTNFCGSLRQIDANCELIDWLCDIFSGKGVADHDQLAKIDYCRGLADKLAHHDITDEQVAKFIFYYQGALGLDRIEEDPSDLKLVVCVIKSPGSVFLTNDWQLFRLSDQERLEHWCFKAPIHHQPMFDEAGKHPFFHYGNDKRCPLCDSKNQCSTKSKPPQKR